MFGCHRQVLGEGLASWPCEASDITCTIASKSRVIYVGMTGFLMSRILQHKAGEGGQFSSKYCVHRLVYYEVFEHVETAIRRETEIKKWRREKKVALIEQDNPTWEDLAADWVSRWR